MNLEEAGALLRHTRKLQDAWNCYSSDVLMTLVTIQPDGYGGFSIIGESCDIRNSSRQVKADTQPVLQDLLRTCGDFWNNPVLYIDETPVDSEDIALTAARPDCAPLFADIRIQAESAKDDLARLERYAEHHVLRLGGDSAMPKLFTSPQWIIFEDDKRPFVKLTANGTEVPLSRELLKGIDLLARSPGHSVIYAEFDREMRCKHGYWRRELGRNLRLLGLQATSLVRTIPDKGFALHPDVLYKDFSSPSTFYGAEDDG